MKPIRLTMQAFGSYGEKTVIDFTKPNQRLFLITGDTGAGKTTIFDAMVFALFGEASSESNKKDGAELQSQFMDYSMEPYAELCFTEWQSGREEEYVVRRSPRHFRPLRKGSGFKEEKETVSLQLPDGREYSRNTRETDEKLREIIGLTKPQFMQLAMIAQGEFMELLRARSEDKKLIFRKLFHTGLFQNVMEELGKRRKEKLGSISEIRTAALTEIAHVVVPEDFSEGEELSALKKKMQSSVHLNIADMERLLSLLETEESFLTEKLKEREALSLSSGKLRDAKRDALTRADALVESYRQLAAANAVLSECEKREEKAAEAEKLMGEIEKSYELRGSFLRVEDSRKQLLESKKGMKEQEEQIPRIREGLKKEEELSGSLEEELKKRRESYVRLREKVENAIRIFEKKKEAEQLLLLRYSEQKESRTAWELAKERLLSYQESIRSWREEVETLPNPALLREELKREQEELQEAEKEWKEISESREEIRKLQERVKNLQLSYQTVRAEVERRSREYQEKNNAFLDEQAGFLAKEKLRAGEPCPVCGSLEHPCPAELSERHETLTREDMERLSQELSKSRQRQESLAREAGERNAELKSKEEVLKKRGEGLQDRICKIVDKIEGGISESFENSEELNSIKTPNDSKDENTLSTLKSLNGINVSNDTELQTLFTLQEKLLSERAEKVKREEKHYQELQERLRHSAENSKKLEELEENASTLKHRAETELEKAKLTLEELSGRLEFSKEEEAREQLRKAEGAKQESEKAYEGIRNRLESGKASLIRSEALLKRYQDLLPLQEKAERERSTEYEELLSKSQIEEAYWQAICQNHRIEEAKEIEGQLRVFREKKTAALAKREASLESIKGQEKPDLETLKREFQEAEKISGERLSELQKKQEELRITQGVKKALLPKMQERAELLQDFQRIDSLYNRLAGKVSGARMDIETFVQRYYLKRILQAANRRFLEMSAGQFELRQTSEEQAGEGKNRGLDLMIYSTVTGKEREIRTLSGGESFMAALSLALGMGDLIQQSSASIHLDMMFIDEGFGSLDEHSRNQAVRVLQHMADSSKLIGIISHVTELKQEIEDQLLVTKDENGSHVNWQIS